MTSLKDVKYGPLNSNFDIRGSLFECWRIDDIEYNPAMLYLSWTKPNQKRGPHEHIQQTDFFIFPGPGLFDIIIWETPERWNKFEFGSDNPGWIIIPPKIIHGYRNISMIDGLVINIPNMLYKGKNKQQKEDIIRWEDLPENPYHF